MKHICIDCHQELDVIQQSRFQGGYITLVTCWNPDCNLSGITLTPEQFKALNTEQLEEYRITVRNRKYAEGTE
jgi:hypothetical protein